MFSCVHLPLICKLIVIKIFSSHKNRDLKQGRRRRLGERNKFAYSVGKNNSFARPARAFHILIHFFAVLVLTTTWNDQIWGHVEDESTWRRIFKFLFKYPHRSHQFYSWIAHSHFPSRTTWSNRKIITVTGNNIFRQRSRSRRRRPCLRSLIFHSSNTADVFFVLFFYSSTWPPWRRRVKDFREFKINDATATKTSQILHI